MVEKCGLVSMTTTTTTVATAADDDHHQSVACGRRTVDTNGVDKIYHQRPMNGTKRKNGYRTDDGLKLKNGYVHSKVHPQKSVQETNEEPPLLIAIITYFGLCLIILFGYLNDFLRKAGVLHSHTVERRRRGYTPLYQDPDDFFKRNIFRRVRDILNRPICSVPGPEIVVMERITKDHGWHFELTGRTYKAINMASYNYLGFAENTGPCATAAEKAVFECGFGVCSSRNELGTHKLHLELEKLVARFLGVEDSLTFNMGFATNSLNLPTLVDDDCLIISDAMNHSSLILGSRLSGASIRVFQHNNMKDLENCLRDAVVNGRPRTHRPWKKILIVVEGVYSMEGTIVNLPEVIRLKKKYKAYLYLDEAHSIGALGTRGRGVTDYFGCDPLDVDVLMGTFTKSFGAVGGYIAGSKKLINYLRTKSHSSYYAVSMPAPIIKQILMSMITIMGEDGTNEGERRLKQIARNCQYFHYRLREMGFIVYGHSNSPIVPVLGFVPGKVYAFTKMMVANGVATVGVSFPAVPIHQSRIRFCISAAHSKEMLDEVLDVIHKVGKHIHLMCSKRPRPVLKYIYSDD